MAARYGGFARSARSAFYSPSNPFRASSSTMRSPVSSRRAAFEYNSARPRRRCVESIIPLHNVAASAKLVSHLSVNSRSSGSLSVGIPSVMQILLYGKAQFQREFDCLRFSE